MVADLWRRSTVNTYSTYGALGTFIRQVTLVFASFEVYF